MQLFRPRSATGDLYAVCGRDRAYTNQTNKCLRIYRAESALRWCSVAEETTYHHRESMPTGRSVLMGHASRVCQWQGHRSLGFAGRGNWHPFYFTNGGQIKASMRCASNQPASPGCHTNLCMRVHAASAARGMPSMPYIARAAGPAHASCACCPCSCVLVRALSCNHAVGCAVVLLCCRACCVVKLSSCRPYCRAVILLCVLSCVLSGVLPCVRTCTCACACALVHACCCVCAFMRVCVRSTDAVKVPRLGTAIRLVVDARATLPVHLACASEQRSWIENERANLTPRSFGIPGAALI